MPARRRKRTVNEKTPISRRKIIFITITILFLCTIGIVLKGISDRTENYFTLAETLPSGDLVVTYIDLQNKESLNIIIPKDTEVNLARQRGILRASSIKKIIDSENIDRQIIADTVTKTFRFPVDYWKSGILTDMPFFLRMRLKLAELSGLSVIELQLDETSYLISTKLPDGEEGYRVRDTMPLSLQSVFADPSFAGERLAVNIVNKTGKGSYNLNTVIKVLDVLGMKVAPIQDEEEEEMSCIVISQHESALKRVASVFNCESELKEPSAFDIEIIFGRDFYERF